jgi:hypothetical protein
LGGDRDAAAFTALFDSSNASYFFYNAGKHERLRMNPTS